jgi:hypothetical protein
VLAANLAGGILAWVGEGMPVTDSRGVPVRRVHVFGPKWNALPPGYKAVW